VADVLDVPDDAPEHRIIDGNLGSLFAIGLPAQQDCPRHVLVILLIVPGFTNNNIIFVSGFGRLWPNKHLLPLQI
jgi:hypothetical protein